MEANKDNHEMLELMPRPAFCTDGTVITCANAAARAMFLTPGTAMAPLLFTGLEEYGEYLGGCLHLELMLGNAPAGAWVSRIGGEDVFVLDAAGDEDLQTMALASRELREPLNDLLAIAGTLLPQNLPEGCGKAEDLLARMTRGLCQLQRILGNMSDAGQSPCTRLETRNLRAVFDEIFTKAAALLAHTGIRLEYQGLPENLLGQIDAGQMERAALNMLSNSLKFLPPEGLIQVRLTRRGDTLQLSVTDNGSGIEDAVLHSVFSRYLRPSAPEDSRFGLGLGMVVIREAAARHGGTVLIHRPPEGGTRVSLTMKIIVSPAAQVRCVPTDLTGGQDQALVELSQFLPPELYRRK